MLEHFTPRPGTQGQGYQGSTDWLFGFVPSANAMTAHGMPYEYVTPLQILPENSGRPDGVSHTSTSQPTSVLVTLAAAGRNPTDILGAVKQ